MVEALVLADLEILGPLDRSTPGRGQLSYQQAGLLGRLLVRYPIPSKGFKVSPQWLEGYEDLERRGLLKIGPRRGPYQDPGATPEEGYLPQYDVEWIELTKKGYEFAKEYGLDHVAKQRWDKALHGAVKAGELPRSVLRGGAKRPSSNPGDVIPFLKAKQKKHKGWTIEPQRLDDSWMYMAHRPDDLPLEGYDFETAQDAVQDAKALIDAISKKRFARGLKPEGNPAADLIAECQKLWEHYCARPGKKRLREVFAHLETMKSSKSAKVKLERRRCLRAANQEAKGLGL